MAASAVMMAVETVNGRVLYPELGKMAEGAKDREVLRQLLATAPVRAESVADHTRPPAGHSARSLARG